MTDTAEGQSSTDPADRPSGNPIAWPLARAGAAGHTPFFPGRGNLDDDGLIPLEKDGITASGSAATAAPAEVDDDRAGPGWQFLAFLGLITAVAFATGQLAVYVIILFLIGMIFLHELGHYLTAKWAGMKVTEFFIGFGPRLWSFKRGETEYGFKAIPAGAYVRIIGMSNLEEIDPEDEDRTYRAKPYWRRLSVVTAGSIMHFIQALVVLFLLFFTGPPLILSDIVGRDTVLDTSEVGSVQAESGAANAGLQAGDEVIAVDGRPVATFEDLVTELAPRPNETVILDVRRGAETLELEATLGERVGPEGEKVGLLGVTRTLAPADGAFTAAANSGEAFVTIGTESVLALGRFFTPSGLSGFASQVLSSRDSGPAVDSNGSSDEVAPSASSEDENRLLSLVGAVRLGTQAADNGVNQAMFLFVLLNIFIGLFNLVPLLPLDGGHVAIATYEKIRSRKGHEYRADVAKLMPLTYAVVLVLIFVGVSALYLDIVDPISLGGQ